MAKSWAKWFYKSDAWQSCRRGYIAERKRIDGGMCETCGERLGYIVHHKEALTPANIGDPNITLSHDNLVYVCKPCHDEEEDHFVKRKSGCCIFGADGQPIDMRRLDG